MVKGVFRMTYRKIKRICAAVLMVVMVGAMFVNISANHTLAEQTSETTVTTEQFIHAGYDRYVIQNNEKKEEIVVFYDYIKSPSYFVDASVPEITFVFPPSVDNMSNFNSFNYDYVMFYDGDIRYIAEPESYVGKDLSGRTYSYVSSPDIRTVPIPVITITNSSTDSVEVTVDAEPLAAIFPVTYTASVLLDDQTVCTMEKELTKDDSLRDLTLVFNDLPMAGSEYTVRIEKSIAYTFGEYTSEPVCRNFYTKRSEEQNTILANAVVNLSSVPLTDSFTVTSVGSYINWEGVANVSHFVDASGHFAFACCNTDTITVYHTANGKVTKTISLPRSHTIYGTVICDDEGNYWVVEGDAGTAAGDQTVFISKYAATGKLIASISDAGTGNAVQNQDNGAKIPFAHGNCDAAIQDGIFLVNFAKSMYNGHQASANVGVNMDSMEKVYFDFYNSHSFANSVIPYDAARGFALLSQGDCYPRAFRFGITDQKQTLNTLETFHFWVQKDTLNRYDMSLLNKTYARTGGFAEVSTGIAFAGTSVRSLSEAALTETQDLFIQIFNPNESDVEKAMITSGNRSGVAGPNGDTSVTDYGVKWLTDAAANNITVSNPKLVKMDQDLVIVLCEIKNDNSKHVGIGYFILDAYGNVIKQDTISTAAKLTPDEDLIYADGAIQWVMNNNANKLCIYRLNIDTKDEWSNPFIDISESDSYYDAIEFVYENGLFKGISDVEFAPEMTMTRAMFVTVLGRLAGIDANTYSEVEFADVKAGAWYAPYVAWASEEGLVLGYGNGLFGTDDEITVEQTVVLLARYADDIGISLDSTAVLDSFFDADEVADWASAQMKWAVGTDIYSGSNGNLHPKALAKRWMLADMLMAFVNNCIK